MTNVHKRYLLEEATFYVVCPKCGTHIVPIIFKPQVGVRPVVFCAYCWENQ